MILVFSICTGIITLRAQELGAVSVDILGQSVLQRDSLGYWDFFLRMTRSISSNYLLLDLLERAIYFAVVIGGRCYGLLIFTRGVASLHGALC